MICHIWYVHVVEVVGAWMTCSTLTCRPGQFQVQAHKLEWFFEDNHNMCQTCHNKITAGSPNRNLVLQCFNGCCNTFYESQIVLQGVLVLYSLVHVLLDAVPVASHTGLNKMLKSFISYHIISYHIISFIHSQHKEQKQLCGGAQGRMCINFRGFSVQYFIFRCVNPIPLRSIEQPWSQTSTQNVVSTHAHTHTHLIDGTHVRVVAAKLRSQVRRYQKTAESVRSIFTCKEYLKQP